MQLRIKRNVYSGVLVQRSLTTESEETGIPQNSGEMRVKLVERSAFPPRQRRKGGSFFENSLKPELLREVCAIGGAAAAEWHGRAASCDAS